MLKRSIATLLTLAATFALAPAFAACCVQFFHLSALLGGEDIGHAATTRFTSATNASSVLISIGLSAG